MSTETEIVEVKEEKIASPDNDSAENQYKIFDYFKGNTGMLIACVSALVAIGSWLLRFAVGRMNYAYLAYWDISSLHANINNQSELYVIACALIYGVALILIRGFLSKISDAFRYYIPFLAMINRGITISKREDKQLLKEIRKISFMFIFLPSKAKESTKGKAIKEKIKGSRNSIENDLRRLQHIKKSRQKIIGMVLLQTVITIVLAYLLGSLFLSLVNMTATIRENLHSSKIIVLLIVIELMGQYVPACIESSRLNKQYQDEEIPDKVVEMCDEEIPKFPHEILKNWKIKSILTDRILKKVVAYSLIGAVILLVGMSILGTMTAKTTRQFPIYSAQETMYAVVYTSGSTRYMEEAVIENGTLVIDTTKQRIIISDDISYTVEAFDDVSVIRLDNTLKSEKEFIPVKKTFTAIGTFVEAIWIKVGEVLTKDAECVPGT